MFADRLKFANEMTELAHQRKKVDVEEANRKCWVFTHNDNPLLVHELFIADLTPEDYKGIFVDRYMDYMAFIQANPTFGKFTCKVLEVLPSGEEILQQRMDVPIPLVTARSMIVCRHTQKTETGGHMFMVSSKGCEEFEVKYKKNIGKDVLATLEVNFWQFEAENGGTRIRHVMCSKPNGKMPDFAVEKMTKAQAKSALTIAQYVRDKKAGTM